MDNRFTRLYTDDHKYFWLITGIVLGFIIAKVILYEY